MDPISDLDFFVRLARLGRLSSAAQAVGVTPSTASKRLAKLEQRLGVRLFERTTRQFSLTPDGETYLAGGSRLLEALGSLEDTLAGGDPLAKGSLRVHASLGFGRRFITPLVSSFVTRHPDIDIQLHLSDRFSGWIDQGFDLAIRVGEPPDATLLSRKLASNRRIVCAAPLYLRDGGVPEHPGELQAHRCIVIRENDDPYCDWVLCTHEATEVVKVRAALSTNDGTTAVAWALDAHGVVMRSQWEVAPHLRSGRLKQVLPEWSREADVHAVFPTHRPVSAKGRAFVDYLADAFAARASAGHRLHGAW